LLPSYVTIDILMMFQPSQILMTAVEPKKNSTISYPVQTIERAERAIRCSPFQLKLLAMMQATRVELKAIADDAGVKNGYTRSPLTEIIAENHLLWLIQVGLLRREVDGQGITDSFRLTPLGRQLVEKWQPAGSLPPATGCDRVKNALNRWLTLPV
jgi:hypothetical protein